MNRLPLPHDPCEVEAMILRSLVRMLMEKGLLSEEDVRTLLLHAVEGLNIAPPNTVGTQAANDFIVEAP